MAAFLLPVAVGGRPHGLVALQPRAERPPTVAMELASQAMVT